MKILNYFYRENDIAQYVTGILTELRIEKAAAPFSTKDHKVGKCT